MPDGTIKRVTISKSNLEKAEKLAHSRNLKLSEYLDRLINTAIIEDHKTDGQRTPFYIWKS